MTVTDPLPAGVTLNANATCVAGGTSSCGTVTGTTGQTSFGATTARIDAGAANAIVFTVPVAFASGMTTTPLINTATATDIPTGITANGSDSDVLSANVSLAVTKTDGSATYTPGGSADLHGDGRQYGRVGCAQRDRHRSVARRGDARMPTRSVLRTARRAAAR